jgi:mRNA interferase MazF
MAASLKGLMVVIYFPFSDVSATKKRPALVVSDWGANDVILCQITSVASKDEFAVSIIDSDIIDGALMHENHIRTNKLFTANKTIFLPQIGFIRKLKLQEVIGSIQSLFKNYS